MNLKKYYRHSWIVFFLFAVLLTPGTAKAQLPEKITTDIGQAFLNSDYNLLGNMLLSTLELDIDRSKGKFSKSQAQMILKDWFALNKPASYELKQEGKTSSSFYIIGFLYCDTGSYRIYMLLNETAGEMNIHFLSISKHDL
ncbi:MAG: DUF4783 domain-containing protein [Bacteroidetes bacterium]|nr:DUF4783 domain-containing protein [Bacteroidota bacterium]